MSLAFFLYGADFELCECKNSTRSSLGFFFPFHFWHNSAAELILLRLSKKTWTETRHMIFHTERNWFLKRQSSWGRARSGMLGWGSPLGGAKRADPGASQEEERRRGTQAIAKRVEKPRWLFYQLLGCTGVPRVPQYLPSPVFPASPVLPCARPTSMCGAWGGAGRGCGLVWRSLLCLSFLPFIPNVPSCLPLLSQALSPVIRCPVFFELCCRFIIFSIEVTRGKAAHQRCDCI